MNKAQYDHVLDVITYGQPSNLNQQQVRHDVLAYFEAEAHAQHAMRQCSGAGAFKADMFIKYDMFGFDDVMDAGFISTEDAESLYATIRSLEV